MRYIPRILPALALGATVGISAALPHRTSPADSTPIPVRFAEGAAHAFVDLHTAAGPLLAHGDLTRTVHGDTVESHLVFHFAPSVFEETVSYTQHDVFAMQSYHLVQSGPAFASDIDATLSRSGAYVVKTKSHDDGKEKSFTGTLDLPADTYNGMGITVGMNLPAGATPTVHIVGFTPEPRLIGLQFVPTDTTHVLLGTRELPVSHIVAKPILGALLRFFATIAGKAPPDSDLWLVTDQVPAFVRFQGPLYSGPVWRIDMVSPTWPTGNGR